MRFLTLILIFSSYLSFAQTPCFTLSPTSGCMGQTFTITDCSGGSTIFYQFGTNPLTTNTSHVFGAPGTYKITQFVNTVGQIFDSTSLFVTVKDTVAPQFEVDICANRKIQIKVPNIGYDEYKIYWGDTFSNTYSASATATHTYTNTTPKDIVIEGIHQPEGCGNSFRTTITPVLNLEKAIIDTLQVINNGNIKLTISGQAGVKYTLNVRGSGGALIKSKEIIADSDIFIDTISGLNTSTNTYCIDVETFNPCSGAVQNTSDQVCSVVLSATAEEGYNNVSWATYAGDNFDNFALNKNAITPFNIFLTSQNPYSDSSIFCNQEYNYQLVVNHRNATNSISISNIAKVIGKSEKSPSPVTNVFSTYNDANQLVISWKSVSKIPPFFYSINSYQATDTFVVINSFDKECYEITYTDSCGNRSQISDETCPIILEAEQNGLFEIEVEWTDFVDFENGLDAYELEIYDFNKNLILTENMGATTNYLFDITDETNQIYYFKVIGKSTDSIITSSNEVQLIVKNRIVVPNAFSPNGNNQNDIFIPVVRFINDFKMSIYNKWGASLFTSDNINEGWDGDGFPAGVYTYVIEIVDYTGKKTTKNGTVTLIR